MNYIINPSWFYWLSIANGAKIVFLVTAGIASLVTVLGFIQMAACMYYGTDDKDYKTGVRVAKVGGIVAVVCVLAGVFIPSKQTIIAMMVAKFATYENAQLTVDAVKDAVKDAVDYIVQAIKSIR